MGACHALVEEPFCADRALADTLREANELRRARSLPEYTPTTNVRTPPPGPLSRVLARRLRLRAPTTGTEK